MMSQRRAPRSAQEHIFHIHANTLSMLDGSMQANMSSNSVTIALELGDGSHVPFELSSRMRRRCFVLSAIPPGAILRGVQFEPFRAVMNYLHSGECPPIFTGLAEGNASLLLFAQTWVLAAQLGLTGLQNDLMTMMIGIHANIVDGRGADLDFQYTTDESLLEAFQYLRDQIGRNSHAENFLICFAGRTAPSISELERNLDTTKTDPAIRNEILTEARSFSPDPIKNQPEVFFVNDKRPPSYPQLEMQPNKTALSNGRWTSAHTTHPIDVDDADRPQLTKTFGEFGNGTQKHSSKTPKHKYRVGHLRSPDSTHTLLHSSFSNQPDEACDPGVRIHVGDPDDPNLSYPSQGVENPNGDLSASTVYHDGVLHSDRPLSLPLPSVLPPLSSPSPPSASLQCPRPPVSPHTHLSSHRSFVGSQDRGLKAPCVIQVYQYNNKAHDNAYRIHNESENTVAAQVQGRGKGGDRTVRAVANSGRQSQKLIRQKKGKRCRWFCLLTCGSKHY